MSGSSTRRPVCRHRGVDGGAQAPAREGRHREPERAVQVSARDRNQTVPSGWLSMLLAVGFVALGLVLLMLQAMAFLLSKPRPVEIAAAGTGIHLTPLRRECPSRLKNRQGFTWSQSVR